MEQERTLSKEFAADLVTFEAMNGPEWEVWQRSKAERAVGSVAEVAEAVAEREWQAKVKARADAEIAALANYRKKRSWSPNGADWREADRQKRKKETMMEEWRLEMDRSRVKEERKRLKSSREVAARGEVGESLEDYCLGVRAAAAVKERARDGSIVRSFVRASRSSSGSLAVNESASERLEPFQQRRHKRSVSCPW